MVKNEPLWDLQIKHGMIRVTIAAERSLNYARMRLLVSPMGVKAALIGL